MKYPRIEIAYADEAGTQAVHDIEPVASLEMTMHYGERTGFLLTAHDVTRDVCRAFTMAHIRRWGAWDEERERMLFETTCFAHYLQKREERLLRNVPSLFDNKEDPYTREVLFERRPNSGDYVAVAYQQAWGGWKLARGAA